MHIRALFLTNDVGGGGGKLVQPPPEMKHCKKKKNCKYRANTFSAVIFSFSGEKLLELQHRHRKLCETGYFPLPTPIKHNGEGGFTEDSYGCSYRTYMQCCESRMIYSGS